MTSYRSLQIAIAFVMAMVFFYAILMPTGNSRSSRSMIIVGDKNNNQANLMVRPKATTQIEQQPQAMLHPTTKSLLFEINQSPRICAELGMKQLKTQPDQNSVVILQ